MTVQTEFHNWQSSPKSPDPRSCSPLLNTMNRHLTSTYGGQNLGCYASRPVQGGSSPSSHASGAALDWRYENPGPGRALMLGDIMPWLINNSLELGVQAIHDYVGCRIWRPPGCSGRPSSPSPDCGWKQQTPGSEGGNMGNAGAQWIHIEVLASRWADTRSIDEMIGAGGFLMALTDQQQADMFNRVMGALPGEFSDSQRGPGGSGDGLRRFALDDQDGNYIVTLLERIAAKLGA